MNSERGELRQNAGMQRNEMLGGAADRHLREIVRIAMFAFGVATIPTILAQSPPTPDESKYCYKGSCTYFTKTEAEVAMRADPELQGQGKNLKLVDTIVDEVSKRAQYIYRLQPTKPETVYAPMYTNAFEANNPQRFWKPNNPKAFGCTPRAEDPLPYFANWCAQGGPLFQLALQNYLIWLNDPECINPTVDIESSREDTTPYPEHRIIIQDPDDPKRGIAAYGYRIHGAGFDCHPPEGSGGKDSSAKAWYVPKVETFVCPPLYKATEKEGIVLTEPTEAAEVCVPETETDYVITGPFDQTDDRCGGKFHCRPSAAGDKSFAETDFVFADRPFTRHYHSLGQLRSDAGFAEGWTYPYTDKVIRHPNSAVLRVMDDEGTYETYTSIDGVRYASDNSVDHRLDVVNAGGIGYRLRSPDGEIKEFDADGRLIAVRDPRAPQNDVTILRLQDKIVALTDARGRQAFFAYRLDGLLIGIQLPDQSVIRYQYDDDDNLVSVDRGNGQIKQYHYHEAGLATPEQLRHLTGITSEDGARYASFAYDSMDRVTSSRVLGNPNNLTTLTYHDADHLTAVTASGESRGYTLQPDLYRRVLSVTESNGSESHSYNAQGRLQSVTDKRGVQTSYAYTDGYLSTLTEAAGTPQQRRTETVRDPVTHLVTERRVYDASNVLKAKTSVTYNARGQVTATTITDPATNTTRTSSNAYCEEADVLAGACPIVGLLKSMNGPRSDVNDVTSFAYRQADDPACVSAPVTCAYRKGDLWTTTNALGHAVEILRYDGAGRTLSVKDANGVVTDLEYDLRGRMTTRKVRGSDDSTEADDRITHIEYWPTGEVKKITQPDGAFVSYSYDAARRLTAVSDGDGNAIAYTLNGAGERVKEDTRDHTGTLRKTMSRVYDTLGQLQILADAYGRNTSFTYDADGHLDRTTDALGRVSDNNNDALGRLSRSLQDMNGIAAETKFNYDALDRLTQVTDPKGLNTNYTYNGFGELKQQTSPDTGTATYGYDSAGNRIIETNANGKIAQTSYDALNRPIAVTYPQDATLNVAYIHDAAQSDCVAGETFLTGRLAKMTDHSGSTVWCYNHFGQLTRKVQRTQGRVFTLRWSYLPNGRLSSMTYPDDVVVDYLYDAQGRVVEIGATAGNGRQQVLRNASYHPFGPVAQWTYGNGRVMTRTINLNGQPGIVQDPVAGGLSLGYEFDEVGNLKKLRSGNQNEPPLRVYGYDGLNRLTEAKDGSNVLQQSYGYDKTGNRTDVGRWVDDETAGATWMTQSLWYQIQSHRLQSVGTTGQPDANLRIHDAAGNLTVIEPATTIIIDDPPPGGGEESSAYGGAEQMASVSETPPGYAGDLRQYGYTASNRMASVMRNGVLTMSYRYNGMGERVYRTGSGQVVHTVFDPSGQWIGDYDANGQAIQQAIWLGDLPVGLARNQAGALKLHYVQPDALGTPRAVIDPVRDVAVWRWALEGEAFGNDAPNQDPDGDGIAFVLDLRFPGQQYDSATGFNYNYFRDFDPGICRYIEPDPIGLKGGVSLYGYVGGNPMARIDPFGLQTAGTTTMPGYGPIDWSWLRTAGEWVGRGVEFGTTRAVTGATGIGLLLYSPEMGYSECEAPGVNFAQCMERRYPRRTLPIVRPHADAMCPPDAKDCEEIRKQCRDRCWRILERPLPHPRSDINTNDFFKCVNKCLEENDCL